MCGTKSVNVPADRCNKTERDARCVCNKDRASQGFMGAKKKEICNGEWTIGYSFMAARVGFRYGWQHVSSHFTTIFTVMFGLCLSGFSQVFQGKDGGGRVVALFLIHYCKGVYVVVIPSYRKIIKVFLILSSIFFVAGQHENVSKTVPVLKTIMTSKFIIENMLPKYNGYNTSENLLSAVNYSLGPNSNNSSPSGSNSPPSVSSVANRMYPYVSAEAAHHHHQQQQAAAVAAFGGGMVPGPFSTSGSSALAAAAAMDAADKSCRYTASLTGNVPTHDSMVNYSLHGGHNGTGVSAANSVTAAASSMAAAAQFYQQHAAAASAVADPLTSCSQLGAQAGATAGQALPDIPRYPWMSITGIYLFYISLYVRYACMYFGCMWPYIITIDVSLISNCMPAPTLKLLKG